MKALFVDDESYILTLVQNFFKLFGVELDCSLTHEEGLSLIKNNSYDILFLDYNLSDMDLTQYLDNVRDIKNDIVVVIESGEDEAYITLPEMNDIYFLKKPFTIYHLRDLLLQIFPDIQITKFDNK